MTIALRALCLSMSLLWLAQAPSTRAEDWLQFRGTAGDGESRIRDLPTTWSAKEKVKWRTELPGEGWSSPVTVGKRIFVTAAIPVTENAETDRDLALLIIDADSGSLRERVKLFTQPATAPRIHSKNSHASPTPIIDGDRVYIHFGHGGTACTTLDGKLVWANDKLKYPPVHGNGGSPALVDGLLIFSQDGAEEGKVIALSASTVK